MEEIVEKCTKLDYIAVAGTSEFFPPATVFKSRVKDIFEGVALGGGSPLPTEFAEQVLKDMRTTYDFGNKMMFLGQAVRALRLNAADADYRTFVYFTTGYTALQKAKAEEAAAKYASPGRVFPISSSAELLTILNAPTFPGETCERKILRIDFFSHGVPGELAFGYEGIKELSQEFKFSQVAKMDPARFKLPQGRKAEIYSWACRTANSGDDRTIGGLAPQMAAHTGARVHAYARRTLYSQTWNSGSKSETEAGLERLDDSKSNIVIWHPEGALGPVIEDETPPSAPSGRFTFE